MNPNCVWKSPSWRKRLLGDKKNERNSSTKNRTEENEDEENRKKGKYKELDHLGIEKWRLQPTPLLIDEDYMATEMLTDGLQISVPTIDDSGETNERSSPALDDGENINLNQHMSASTDIIAKDNNEHAKNLKLACEEVDKLLNLSSFHVGNKRIRKSSSKRFSKLLSRKSITSHHDENMLQSAVSNYDYEMLEKMLSNNNGEYDINVLYPPGVSLLHQACVLGDFDIIKLLVDKGADVNVKTWTQLSPTKIATLYGHFDIAQLLLLRGAKVEDIMNGSQPED